MCAVGGGTEGDAEVETGAKGRGEDAECHCGVSCGEVDVRGVGWRCVSKQ